MKTARRPLKICTVALLFTALVLAACGRSDEEIAEQRRVLEMTVADAPVPEGSRLDTKRARFDKGCQGLAECADANETAPIYQVPIDMEVGAPTKIAEICTYLVERVEEKGFSLVAAWNGASATSATTTKLQVNNRGLQPRWIDVDATACATGHVTSAVVVKQNGAALHRSAFLALSITSKDGDVAPSYIATYAQTDPLPTDNAPLTVSELAHLSGVLQKEFVVAADPIKDGIRAEGRVRAMWTVPETVRALTFTITCTAGDDVDITVIDETEANPTKRADARTHVCTGAQTELTFPQPATTITVDISVHEHPRSASSAPRSINGPYLVEVATTG